MSSKEKRKMTKTEKPSTLQTKQIPSFPDDLLLSFFARSSRIYYPTLSLVSKTFKCLLTLPVLYQNRKVINRTESCLYVFLNNPNPRVFTLSRKPNKTLTSHVPFNKKCSRSGNILIPVQKSLHHWKCVVSVGSNIYAIGEQAHPKTRIFSYGTEVYSCGVSVLDCRTHTWRECPSMLVKRSRPSANVVDGKIYVAGGCNDRDSDSSEWMEVFDTETGVWEVVESTLAQRQYVRVVYMSLVINGDIYMFGNDHGVIYKPRDNIWEGMQVYPDGYEVKWSSWCVIGNVLYGYSYRKGIQWYNFTLGEWNTLMGYVRFPGLPKNSGCCVRLVDCGGKMAVLWDEKEPFDYRRLRGCDEEMVEEDKKLWCGVIKLKKLNCDEICGEVEWFDPLLTVPSSYAIEHVVSAIV